MIPGNAPRRSALPWLPYPQSDKVLINAHNFGGSPTFTPADLAPSLWLRADDGVTLSGTAVSSWADSAGGRSFAPPAGDRLPEFIASDSDFAGKPSLQFTDGGSGDAQRLVANTGFGLFRNLGSVSVIGVFNQTQINRRGVLIAYPSTLVEASRIFTFRGAAAAVNTAEARRIASDAISETANPGTTTDTTPAGAQIRIADIDYETGLMRYLDRGSTTGPYTTTLASTGRSEDVDSNLIHVGAGSDVFAYRWAGQIAEIIVIPRKLSDAEYNQLANDWLLPRYGLPWTNL